MALYLHGPGIDDPIAMVRDVYNNGSFESTEVFVFTKDHLGSVRELSDLQQNPIQRYNYSAYGRTRIEKLNANSEKLVVNPYAYTSRELDESGDYHFRARTLDTWNGRFLSPDPSGFDGGDESLYRYVGNQPLRYIDAMGNKAFNPSAGACIAAVKSEAATCSNAVKAASYLVGGCALVGCSVMVPAGALACISAAGAASKYTGLVASTACDIAKSQREVACGPERHSTPQPPPPSTPPTIKPKPPILY